MLPEKLIDLHSHILSGLDDGPETLDESVALAVLYEAAGFSRVVATPHFMQGTSWMPRGEDVVHRVETLNALLEQKGIHVRVFPGMEIAMSGNLAVLLEEKKLLPIAQSSYVLIDSPLQRFPLGWDQIFFTIMAKGYHVVLAHPERCLQLIAKPDLFDEIIESGVYVQANYDSFLGYFGADVAHAAFYLLKKGYLHFLATDCHGVRNRPPGNVREALRVLEETIGPETLNMLTRTNPECVFSGGRVEAPAPAVSKGRKRWRLF